MRTIIIIFVVAILTPTLALAQQLRMPASPVAPTSKAQCDALSDQYSALFNRIMEQWDVCLRTTGNRNQACAPMHRQSDEVLAARQEAVTQCNKAVQQYEDRQQAQRKEDAEQAAAAKKAEQERQERVKQMQRDYEQMQNSFAESQRQRVEDTRRAVEEQQRAAAEAERQRHDASQRAVNDSIREMFTSRDRAQDYNNKAAAVGNSRNVPLTSRDLQSLDSMRSQAEANNLRPRYVPAEPSGYTATGTSALTGAVANLLGAEVQTILKWGLNQTEAGSYLVQTFETAGDYDAKYQSFLKSVDYAQKAWNGTTTYEENVSAVGGTVSVLGGFAFRGTPAIAIQLDRVFSSVSGIQAVELDRLELLVASVDRPLTAEEIRGLSDARAVHALYAPFIPVDRIHRLEAVANETGRVYDAYNRGFFDRMGR